MEIVLPLEEDIMPNGIMRLREKIVKNRGVWEIHLSDADNWPSSPHGHNKEKSEKINLLTGDVYDPRTKTYLYTMSKKTMLYFYRQLTKNPEEQIAQQLLSQKNNITYLKD